MQTRLPSSDLELRKTSQYTQMTNSHACYLINLILHTVIPTPCAFHNVRKYIYYVALSSSITRGLLGKLSKQRRILASFLFVLLRSVFDPRQGLPQRSESSRFLVHDPRINPIPSHLGVFYYYYHLYHHSLCWCSFCASAGRKPCTWGISHSSQSFCSYTKHLSEDSRRSLHADLLNLCHSSSLCYFLDVFYHPLLYCTKRTNNCRDHLLLLLLLKLSLLLLFLSIITIFDIIVIIIFLLFLLLLLIIYSLGKRTWMTRPEKEETLTVAEGTSTQ